MELCLETGQDHVLRNPSKFTVSNNKTYIILILKPPAVGKALLNNLSFIHLNALDLYTNSASLSLSIEPVTINLKSFLIPSLRDECHVLVCIIMLVDIYKTHGNQREKSCRMMQRLE
jgi:hypothetical protein